MYFWKNTGGQKEKKNVRYFYKYDAIWFAFVVVSVIYKNQV